MANAQNVAMPGGKAHNAPMTREEKKVILASSLGTVFEWYDFFLYGSLAAIIAKQFFSGVNETTGMIFALLAFAAGFFVRPFGAAFFGSLGDRIGRKPIIWTSILGVAPFALMLPHADLFWTTVLAVLIGFVLSSAFSAIVVYAQEMMPHRIGMVSGLFFGFAFGMGGLGAAVLGLLADKTSIEYVYHLTAFLPLLGIVAAWLPPSRPAH